MNSILPSRRGMFAKDRCGSSFNVIDAIQNTRLLGLAGCFIGSPLIASPTLNSGELDQVRKVASEAGVTLGLSAGMFNPYQPARSSDVLALGAGDMATGMLKLAEAALQLGQPTLMMVVGTEYDRFNRSVTWVDQLKAVSSFLKRLEPDLHSLGSKMLIKTHQEITSWEVLRLLDPLDRGVFGAGLDPVNLIVRMEDPVAAAARLAGRIGQVHVDDANLMWNGEGYSRSLCPVGKGCIDWQTLIAQIGKTDPDAWYWGEIHRAELTMPFTSGGWFDAHPDIEIYEVATWSSKGQPFTRAPDSLVGNVEERVQAATAFLRST